MNKSIYINGFSREKVMSVIRKNSGGKRSINTNKLGGQYRSESGQCLVGCFIPDEVFKLEWDDNYSPVEEIFNEIENYMPMKIYELVRLQNLHDTGHIVGLEGEDYFKAIEDFIITLENSAA